MDAAHAHVPRTRDTTGFDSPWPFLTFVFGLIAAFAILALVVTLRSPDRQPLRQAQVQRLAATVVVQAREIRQLRQLTLAVADLQAAEGKTVGYLIDSQLSQNHSLSLVARRIGFGVPVARRNLVKRVIAKPKTKRAAVVASPLSPQYDRHLLSR